MVATIKAWIPLALVVTALSGLIYLTVQQDIRQGANDPQIQIAEEIATKLVNGKKVEELISKEEVNLQSSLATFVILFNSGKQPIASSVILEGKIPSPPKGVFDFVTGSR